MKSLFILLLVTISLSAGCTALKVASHVVALTSGIGARQAGIQNLPQVAPANTAKQAAAVNAATKVANQAGAVNAGMIASQLIHLIP